MGSHLLLNITEERERAVGCMMGTVIVRITCRIGLGARERARGHHCNEIGDWRAMGCKEIIYLQVLPLHCLLF